MLAAAAVVAAVALVGGALFVARGDDDATTVATEGDGGGAPPVAGAEGVTLLDAVWPSAVESEIVADAPVEARHQYPWPAARRYLADRTGVEVPEDGFTLVSGDATHAVLTVTDGSVDVELAMQRLGSADDPVWYVVRATSQSLRVSDATYDGSRVRAMVTALVDGDLVLEAQPPNGGGPLAAVDAGPVSAGEVIELDEELPREAGVILRATIVREGGPALSEQLVPAGAWSPAPDADDGAGEPTGSYDGVWPWPDDAVDESVLDDPVDTARAYVASRILDVGTTTASEFQQGDGNSGEVVFSGDVSTTVMVRRLDGRWHVEASASDLVTVHAVDDGSSTVRFELGGELTHTEHISGRGPSTETYDVTAGEERAGYAYTFGRDDIVVRNAFVLDTADGPIALAEFALRAPTGGTVAPPDEAIFAAGGLDAVGTAQGYIEQRLGFIPDDMRLNASASGADAATVDWEGGAVLLRRHQDLWFVTESIGASVSISSIVASGADYAVDVFLGEPGRLLVQALDAEGGVCAETTLDVEGRGEVRVELAAVPCDAESIVATMNEVVAEQAV